MTIEANPGIRIRIGIDIGGTFTDFVLWHSTSGEIETFKLLSTPGDPSQAVLTGIDHILEQHPEASQSLLMIHGSTVATNALLERKGATTALVTTEGFRDVLEIGRQNRPELYQLDYRATPPLVPRKLRFELKERIDYQGQALISLDRSEIDQLVSHLTDLAVESIAVCLLFSFANPIHEQMATEALRQAGYSVSPSNEILAEFREYERTSTTVINAYVTPVLNRYLGVLEEGLESRIGTVQLQVMQSNGGNISMAEARRKGVHCILSGPAGGLIGAESVFRLAASEIKTSSGDFWLPERKLITFDMGGTSTDVSLIDETPKITTEAMVGGYPIGIPVLDIHTIGAGGGSIASVDAGGALRVGPQSAGADPGPACYGRGDSTQDQPTVTDANLVLGRLANDYFLGGRMPLHPERAWNALGSLGKTLQLDPIQTALGIIEVVSAHMARALRVISVERGHDPQDFTLVSFGGAGGLHASQLARELGIPQVMIPAQASTLSALGMLGANVIKDYSRTVMLDQEDSKASIDEFFGSFSKQGMTDLANEGFEPDAIVLKPALDMRYRGQSYELIVPYQDDYLNSFHNLHQRTYGYARRSAPIEIVNLRLRAIGLIPPLPVKKQISQGSDPDHALIANRKVYLSETPMWIPFFDGDLLSPGNRIQGPAIVLRTDTTALIQEADFAEVDNFGNLFLHTGG